jgi:LmbE family N-acetylglucosaminyl deacetylase
VVGAGAAAVRRLGFPDGGVAARTATLTTALAGLLMASDVVVSPWRFDGHPDHEATGYATALAARGRGARHLEAPVWAWHWAAPGDPRVPWPRARVLYLGPILAQRKRTAIGCFTSQLEPDPSTGPGRCCRRGRWPGSGTAARCSSARGRRTHSRRWPRRRPR